MDMEEERRKGARDPIAADQAARQVGESLKSAVDQVRARAPGDGLSGQVTNTVTSGVKEAAAHLKEDGFRSFINSLVAIGKRYPMPTLMLGIGVGFLLSRLRRDSHSRAERR